MDGAFYLGRFPRWLTADFPSDTWQKSQCGELLKQFDGRPDNGRQMEGDRRLVTRTEAATQAGLSEHQTKQAVRVANVPD